MNSWNDDGVTTLPWMHADVIPPIRDVMALRYRLVPYLYTGMRQAALTDEPFIRPLFLDFPDDPAMVNRDDAFLFGDDLLVAPVLEAGARRRAVILPRHPGGWYEVDGGAHHPGGEQVEVEAPLGRPPLFLRAGAMLPLAVAAGDRPSTDDPGRELAIYGLPDRATAVLWEDDGDTADWRDGGTSIRFDLVRDGDDLVVSARAEGRGGATPPTVVLRAIHGQRLRIGACDGVILRL
jgi:alpha-glucosidase